MEDPMPDPEFGAEEWAAFLADRVPNTSESADDLAPLVGDEHCAAPISEPASTSFADVNLTAADVAELWPTPASQEIDALAALMGEAPAAATSQPASTVVEATEAPVAGPPATPSGPVATPQPVEEHYAWLDAVHLVPEFERLVRNYPSIAAIAHPKHGRVIVLTYLADNDRGIRRNFSVGSQKFFDLDELEKIEPETKAFKCRILIKIIPYRVGLRIRCWENRPGGDDPRKKGLIVARESGLAFEERPAVLTRGRR
jgi:hypothetical protein